MTSASREGPACYAVLSGMTAAQRAALLTRLPRRALAAGEYVLRQDQRNRHVLLVEAGRLRVERSADSGGAMHAELGPGDCIGEISTLSGGTASASVCAVAPTTVVLLSVEELEREPSGTVAIALAQTVARRLAQTNAQLEHKHRRAAAALTLQLRSAAMTAMLIFALSFYVLFVALRDPLAGYWPPQAVVSGFLIMVCFGVAWVFVTRVSTPRVLGMALAQARRGTLVGLRLSLPILAAALAIKAAVVWRDPHVPVFDPLLGTVGSGLSGWGGWTLCVLAYVLLSYLQEVVRCAIQGSLAQYLHSGGLPDRWRSIAIATLLFGATHVHLSLGFALLSMAGGAYWGWMYQRERNYWATAISHAAIGIWALFFLGLPA